MGDIMDFFGSGLFWILEGIFLSVTLIGLKIWFEDHQIRMNFWKWISVFIWIIAFSISLAYITTSLGENESVAALRGGIMFGVILFISGLGLWFFLRVKNHP